MTPELRAFVRQRAGGRCEYCRLPDWIELTGPFHVEHVVARQHRGADEQSNLAWACSRCNWHKGPNVAGVDPDSDQIVPLFNPRKEAWDEHFEMLGAMIRGKSPGGRATEWILKFNAERRLELRLALISQGLW